MSYSGSVRHPGSDNFTNVSTTVGGTHPRYGLLLFAYRLDAQGKQYASRATLSLLASDYVPSDEARVSRNSNLSFLAHFESDDGMTFSLKEASGFGSYQIRQPDNVLHGNLGDSCNYNENGSYSFQAMTGSLTLDAATQTFHAMLSPQAAKGKAEHTLTPWQCSYSCPNNGIDAYNELCEDGLTVSGHVSLTGKVEHVQAPALALRSFPDKVFSPANQDELFDWLDVMVLDSAVEQVWRWVLPDYNDKPFVYNPSRNYYARWYGRKNATEFYPDGVYPITVYSDHGQQATQQVQIDNTPPVVHTPAKLVMRNGFKGLEVIVEDPAINGARAGLDPYQLDAYIRSDRAGKWKVAKVNLDAHRLLVHATYVPTLVDDSQSISSDTLVITPRDKVMNVGETVELDFDYSQAAEGSEPPLPADECSGSPMLVPEGMDYLIRGMRGIEPIVPAGLNSFFQSTQRLQATAQKLAAEGVSVPAAPGVFTSGFQVQQIQDLLPFQVKSSSFPESSPSPGASPSAGSSSDPGNQSPKIRHLLETYRRQAEEQSNYRSGLIRNIQWLDNATYQVLTDSTVNYGVEYIPAEPTATASFEDYKFLIDDLQDDFAWQISDLNTYSLVEAIQTHLNLVMLYNHLLRALLNVQLPVDNAPTDTTQQEYFSDNLEGITQPRALVNFVSRRLYAWRERITAKHATLKAEVSTLQNESTLLKAELSKLNQELDTLIADAKAVGIDTTQVEADLAALENGDGGFSTQALPLAVAGGIALRAGAPILGNFVRQAGVQLANTVLANPIAATRAVLAAAGLIAAGNHASKQTQQQIRATERKMVKPNQSPEQMAAHQAELTRQQTLLNDIQQVMQNAQEKQEQAKEKANEADDAQDQIEEQCNSDCLPEFIPEEAVNKIPKEWGKGNLNKATRRAQRKGKPEKPGWKWVPNKSQGVRIDKGDANSTNSSQQVDHVVVRDGGQFVKPDGTKLPNTPEGTLKLNPDAHIPLTDWIRWKTWNSP